MALDSRATNSQSSKFNLLVEHWIPVLMSNGRARRLGVLEALTNAGRIRQIAASNPMDNVALLRFLLAVLMWCKPKLSEEDRRRIDDADGVPDGCLGEKLGEKLGNARQPNPAFNLLGEGPRFYQDASLKDTESRPVADLLVEFPGADSVNHLRHVVHDGSYGFCPACCALGILRLAVWAPANRFYPASVNPGSAAYAFSQRENLLLTLVANMPSIPAQAEQAPWLSDTPPRSSGAITNLAWRPRKLWLNVASEQGSCATCGGCGMLVSSLSNEGGWLTSATDGRTKKFWTGDPHLLKDPEPISLPGLSLDAAAHASKFWRDALRLRGERSGKVVAVGPVVNKFVFHDAVSVTVPEVSAQTRAKLSADCSRKLRDLRKQITRNPERQHPEINAAFLLLAPHTEARIRAKLNKPDATTDDKAFLRFIYEPVVEQVVASTARGSPLRRREAMARARLALESALNKATSPAAAEQEASDIDATKAPRPKRSRKKKGGDA